MARPVIRSSVKLAATKAMLFTQHLMEVPPISIIAVNFVSLMRGMVACTGNSTKTGNNASFMTIRLVIAILSVVQNYQVLKHAEVNIL